jgi:NADH-quinone oxidoreductase subunit M
VENIPILSIITYLPLLGVLLIFALPRMDADATRWTALGVSLVTFLVSLLLLGGNAFGTAAMQFEENFLWLPGVGVRYHLGVDGLSILLVVLTTLLTPLSIAASWTSIDRRVREFHIAMLLLETGVIGAFVSLDLVLFYVFFELSLIPMALIIGVWGSSNRVYAAIKFFLYTLAGSLLMLVAIVATYQRYFTLTGRRTLDLMELSLRSPTLQELNLPGITTTAQFYPLQFQYLVFAAFFIAFAIKVPMFPVHTWLPDAHTEAPTAGSVMLAGVMLKLGGYGMLRFCLPLYPDAARFFAPAIVVLSTIAIIYGALVALPQPDWKRLVAYSSVSHMGFVTLGIFAFNQQALQGAVMVMFAHGLNTAALFLLVGFIYERAHTRQIGAFKGLSTTMPVYASLFLAFTFASIGLPGMTGFVGEFNALMGAFRSPSQLDKGAAIVSTLVVILSAWYMLWLFQRVAQGRAEGVIADAHGHGANGHSPHASADPATQRAPLDPHFTHEEPPAGGDDPRAARRDTQGAHDEPHAPRWADVNRRELATLVPLLALTIVFGFYPAPIFRLLGPALAALLTPFDGGAAAAALGR